ncbi:PhzF family phenazine biosynthesis protein [Rhodospirillaceae bacterium SYSU D60015]|uniref:PhzF family phenazine biosynthesis protein n=1 Tax=Desertibaculum subflavum TaxID=2268458 RepID=UPI000E66FF94
MRAPIFQIDAFTAERFRGNPAAVMPLPDFPDDETMRAIAAENNLAETAFLVADGEAWKLRWFTPEVEVPLCGHATLASAWVVFNRLKPGSDRVDFDTRSGRLTVTRDGDWLTMDFPVRSFAPVATPPALTAALGRAPAQVLDGHNYLAVFDTAADVRGLTPDYRALAELDRMGVVVTGPGDQGYDCVSRYFAPKAGIDEDPVTGSAHCAIAPYWSARTGKREIRAFQASRRGGEILCRMNGDRVDLKGKCAFYMEGHVEI